MKSIKYFRLNNNKNRNYNMLNFFDVVKNNFSWK